VSNDKTEEATPKRLSEAREKGQVARSMDLNGAVVLLAGLLAIASFGPGVWDDMQAMMSDGFRLAADPDVVGDQDGVTSLGVQLTLLIGRMMVPILGVIVVAAVVVNFAQVGFKITPKALKPELSKINPISGAKNVFGPNALVETVKSVAKISVVAAVVAAAILPKIDEIAAMTGVDPEVLAATLGGTIKGVAIRAAVVYLVIGAFDVAWQKYRHKKQMRMSFQDVRMEQKQEELPPEVRGAMRRRQQENARGRMMADVPTADVVVMNPTHFAVALKYDPERAAPTVVAKGQDILALKIRDLARESGVQVVENPPVARALFRQVEVGHAIPEELFQAVAEILAVVFRAARRRKGEVA
jgi:flagellar biosynthetic protein FlhB